MKYGKLEYLSLDGKKGRHQLVNCKCECGKVAVKRLADLRSGHVQSCGCLVTKHNLSRTPEYQVWASMLKRCQNPKAHSYRLYGGRGIAVCAEWQSFTTFLADMGLRPSPVHSIERINNNGNYEKNNCKWATAAEQANNKVNSRFYEWNGQRLTTSQWASQLGVSREKLIYRLKHWSIEKALTY